MQIRYWSMKVRVGPLVGNQEATQIFIIYMHDIVLEISFLDLNNGPNLSPSNWKLLQKSLKIQYIFQKFLCMADRHDGYDFSIENFFWFRPFLIFFCLWWIKKMTRAKKVKIIKNAFFHARQRREGIFDIWSHIPWFLAFLSRASNGSGSNLGCYWGLKMKSWGLYHACSLWKSGLLLDLQQVGPPYYLTCSLYKISFNDFS